MAFRIKIRLTDTLFSKIIRERDNWTCNRCHTRYQRGSRGLECSHFFGRGREATRHDPANACALCTGCHRLWGHGDERPQYEAFMKKRLGESGFKKLDILAHSYQKRDDKIIMLYLKQLAKEFKLI